MNRQKLKSGRAFRVHPQVRAEFSKHIQPHLKPTVSSDLVWQRDSSLGQPPGLLQFLCAIPPELPAQRVAHAGCLTVQRQPGAARSRGAGGGGGRRRHCLPGVHVAVLTLGLLQPFLSVPSLSPPVPKVGAAAWADRLETGCKDGQRTSCRTAFTPSGCHSDAQQGKHVFLGWVGLWMEKSWCWRRASSDHLIDPNLHFPAQSRGDCFMTLFSEFTSCSYQFVDGANPLVCFRLQSGVFLLPDSLNSDTSSLKHGLNMVGFIGGKTFWT